jgi:hypothetical protein
MSFDFGLILPSIPLFLYSLPFIYAGLYLIIKKKPIITPQPFVIIMLILLIQSFTYIIKDFVNGRIYVKSNLFFVLFFIAYLVFFIFYVIFNRQYSVFGINKEDFNKIATDTLDSLNIKYEQITFSGDNYLKIIDLKYEILISLKPFGGLFSISLTKGMKNTKEFYRIIREIKKNITNNFISVDYKIANISIGIGIGILLLLVIPILLFFS